MANRKNRPAGTFRFSPSIYHRRVMDHTVQALSYAGGVVAGKDDSVFPIGATRREFGRLRAIYRAAGTEGNCRLVAGPEGHRFYADLAWPRMLGLMNRVR